MNWRLRPPAYTMFIALITFSISTGAITAAIASATSPSTKSGLQLARWAPNVKVTYKDRTITFKSNGIPNHARQKEYAVPNDGARVPSASTAHATADPTVGQSYSFTFSTNPKKASKTTIAGQGPIGVLISGAVLFNPYEGDGSTVAMSSNFTVKGSGGNKVAFLDSCNGHPTPRGQYHYHGLPTCITSTIDAVKGPSHLLGIAFDGFPIYGDHDVKGKVITSKQLDLCNGITSATPEFPKGIYHYVLLNVADSRSSINCFSGSTSQ